MTDEERRVELAAAITTVSRLMPEGMEVRIYRKGPRLCDSEVETTWPNGEVTNNRATEAMH